MIQICLTFQVNISKKYFLKSKEKFNKTVFKSHTQFSHSMHCFWGSGIYLSSNKPSVYVYYKICIIEHMPMCFSHIKLCINMLWDQWDLVGGLTTNNVSTHKNSKKEEPLQHIIKKILRQGINSVLLTSEVLELCTIDLILALQGRRVQCVWSRFHGFWWAGLMPGLHVLHFLWNALKYPFFFNLEEIFCFQNV